MRKSAAVLCLAFGAWSLVPYPCAAAEKDWRKELIIEGRGGESERLLSETFDAYRGVTTFGEVVQDIEKRHGLRFLLDPGVDVSQELDPYAYLGRPIGHLLYWKARQKDLRYRWEGGALRVGLGPFWEQALRVEGRDRRLERKLRETISIKAGNTPASAILEEIGKKKGLKILVDEKARHGRKVSGDYIDTPVGKYLWQFQDTFAFSYRWEKGVLRVEAPRLPHGHGSALGIMKAISRKNDLSEDPLGRSAFLDYSDAELSSVLEDLSQQAKIPFDLDPALRGARLSVHMHQATLRDLLAVLHDLHGIGHRRMGNGGVALSRAYYEEGKALVEERPVEAFFPAGRGGKGGPRIEGRAGKTAGLLKQRLTWVTRNTPLHRLFWGFEQGTGLKFLLDKPVYEAGTITGAYKGETLSQALKQLSEIFQLSYRWQGDAVAVSREPGLPKISAAFASRAVFDSDLTVDTGLKLIDLIVKERALPEVLASVTERTGQTFEMDSALKDERVTLALRGITIDHFLQILNDEYRIGSRWRPRDPIPLSRAHYSELERCWRREGREIDRRREKESWKAFEEARKAGRPWPVLSREDQNRRAGEEYGLRNLELERRCGKSPDPE